jgi:hypothetical protein
MAAATFMSTAASSMTAATTTSGASATASAWVSAATGCVSGGGCVSSVCVSGLTASKAAAISGCGTAADTSAGGSACVAASGGYSAASGSEPSAAAVDVTSSTGVDEAMTAPAVSVAPVGPWTYAEKDAVIEIASPVETDRGASVGWVFVVAVTTNRRRTADTDHNLRIARRHTR